MILITLSTENLGKIFDIAKKIKELDNEISFLFVGASKKLLNNHEFINSIHFAKLYSLDGDDKNVVKGIEIIDYPGWINLLERCSINVNWV